MNTISRLNVVVGFVSVAPSMSAIVCGCDEQAEGPAAKPQETVAAADYDFEHFAIINADRRIEIANMVFIVQPDPLGGILVSLTATRPGPDGSRIRFGEYSEAVSLAALAKNGLDVAGGPRSNPRGSGVFNILHGYQPKLARMRIDFFDAKEVQGSIKGEFYHFTLHDPAAKPQVIEVDISFTAKLVDRTSDHGAG